MENCGCIPTDINLIHVVQPGKRMFSAETYVGNWFEETVQNTLARDDFMKKRECEELSIQKSQIMADFLLKPVDLTPRRDGYLYYGDSVQIISPGPDCLSAIQEYPFKKYCKLGQLVLSASVPPMEIDHRPFLDTTSIISASPLLYPVVRNSFVIERPDCPTDNRSILRYGDVFRIRAMPTQHFPLYIHSAPAGWLHQAAIHSARPQVRFSDTANPNTLWRVVPLDNLEKLKMDFGIPVPMKTRMLLQHALSGNNLSLEPEYPVYTYFGDEFEVTVHNKTDRVKRPAWTNHWSFDTERGWPKPDKNVLGQAKFSAAINANTVTRSAADDAKFEEEEAENYKNTGEHILFADGTVQYGCSPECQENQEEDERLKECDANPCTVDKFARDQLAESFARMRVDKEVPGHQLPYDYRTAPQPHAHSYRISEQQEFFPNQKYNCSGTECCYPRPPPNQQQAQIPCVQTKNNCYPMEDEQPR